MFTISTVSTALGKGKLDSSLLPGLVRLWFLGPLLDPLLTNSKVFVCEFVVIPFTDRIADVLMNDVPMFRGRKRACVTYCITYILSCITKHSSDYKVLMLGRVLGGIATSLICSSFESWLVAEHNKVFTLLVFEFVSTVRIIFPREQNE